MPQHLHLHMLKIANPPVNEPLLLSELQGELEVTIKREDRIHPNVSGNKFRKLKYNLIRAKKEGHASLLTFGGAFSNHLAAVAAAGQQCGFQTHAIVRGEELKDSPLNPTLAYCKRLGMELHFVSRSLYRHKEKALSELSISPSDFYVIPEGGTNALAVEGCREILTKTDTDFDTIAVAVGTGGTMAGLIQSVADHQQVVGFQVVKDIEIPRRIRTFATHNRWTLVPTHDQVGYAKTPKALIDFAVKVADQTGVVLDPLYTAPMVWHLTKKWKENKWSFGNRILIIHTGGYQSIAGVNQRLEEQKSSLRWPL